MKIKPNEVVILFQEEIGLKNLEKVHFIGHSLGLCQRILMRLELSQIFLGAHLSGYAGYHLQRDFGLTVERITALDPAEPFFAVI